MSGIKDYMKQPKTKLKFIIFNSDRGVYEKDQGLPASHSGKLMHVFTIPAGAVTNPLAIPAGFRAVITKVSWDIQQVPGANSLNALNDGANFISLYAHDAVPTPPENSSITVGNGSGVVGIATGVLTITALFGALPTIAFVPVQYYLVPIT